MNTETITNAVAGMGRSGPDLDLDPGLTRTSAIEARRLAAAADEAKALAQYDAMPLFETFAHHCPECAISLPIPIRLEDTSPVQVELARSLARMCVCTECGAFRKLIQELETTRSMAGQRLERLGGTADGIRRRMTEHEETSPERRELLDKLIDLEAKAAECRATIAESQANLQKVRTDFDEFKALRATKREAAPIYDDVDF